MACLNPLQGYHQLGGGLTFKKSASNGSTLTVNCGQCLGCRMSRSKEWAVRIMHEAKMHPQNCFLTLTYENAPHSLNLKHFQNFMKRLRKHYAPKKIRLFHCGEYGSIYTRPGDPTSDKVPHHADETKDALGRAHYHAILFNIDFEDKQTYKQNRHEQTLYSSPTLSRLWGHGFATIGNVTTDSAAYTARYLFKKVTGDSAATHYTKIDSQGEIHQVKPEYVTMSRGNHYPPDHPDKTYGIGHNWLQKFGEDIYAYDECVVDGKKYQYRDTISRNSRIATLTGIPAYIINAFKKSKAIKPKIHHNAWPQNVRSSQLKLNN